MLGGLLVLAGGFPAAGTRPDEPDTTRVLARVDGMPITASRFNHSYVRYLIRTGRNDTPETRQTHLSNLIATYLLAGEARRRGLDDTDAYRTYADRHLKLAVGGRYFEVTFADSLPPLGEADLREAFRKSKEKVALRHLFFRDPARAQEAHARLEAGADFLTLANEVFATSAFDSSAGYLGFASYWDLDDAVAEAAFDLPVGSYSQPVRSRYGWHILRVEDRLLNPILTEDEFQYRRQGIEAQARIRRNRLTGDRMVRQMMEGLNVQANPEPVRQVTEAIGRVLGRDEETTTRPTLRSEDVAAIRDELTPETMLLTYTLDGRTHPFTALDYFRWLPEMPYAELRSRPAASIGRALRNEVLALNGLALGLEQDPHVQETMRFVTAAFLAGQLRAHLREHAPVEPTEAEVRKAFEHLGYRELREARATYWQIRFPTMQAADSALQAIRAGTRSPEAFASFEPFADADLQQTDLGAHVRRAPLDAPVLACTDESACYVLQVTDRTLRYAELEEFEDEIREQLARHLPEVNLLDSLRRHAAVEVDTLLFEAMMPRP